MFSTETLGGKTVSENSKHKGKIVMFSNNLNVILSSVNNQFSDLAFPPGK